MPDLALFVGALAIAYIVPGPDMILLLQTGALRGRQPALVTAIGLGAARGVHVALAALGLAALLRTSPAIFEMVRIVGAAYLVWLGISILRAPSLVPDAAAAQESPPDDLRRALTRGFLTNLLNPKALLFCSVLLPQFLHPAGGPLAAQFFLLGSVLVATGLVFDTQYALAGNGIGAFLARRPMWQRFQRWLFGSALIGFGVKLLAEDGV
ncbi:LysE family translocator [Chelativorans sp. YIM 93263]|uniref:LysE family translocator n=1 Tax=Chelativorans sp. YIM 93263 TaxID=2906648 RepID=UPI00237878A4|nr:LysE family translocator [Chelativorans sp. YIM 93263]